MFCELRLAVVFKLKEIVAIVFWSHVDDELCVQRGDRTSEHFHCHIACRPTSSQVARILYGSDNSFHAAHQHRPHFGATVSVEDCDNTFQHSCEYTSSQNGKRSQRNTPV